MCNYTLQLTLGSLALAGAVGLSTTPSLSAGPPQTISCAHDGHHSCLPHPARRPVIEIALCLDTSNSMDGLINSARMKLWDIVNDLATARPLPQLRIALLTYGTPTYGADSGWVRLNCTFTEDLDLVSEYLFSLTTNGGTEYVGRVVNTALDQLDWSTDQSTLRMVVVAGNESADQDPVVRGWYAAQKASERDVRVNAILCGRWDGSVVDSWQQVADLGQGHYAAIDQDHGTIVIETPYDDELAALSSAVNETYIPFGADGHRGWANQSAQDRNAAEMNSAAAASRANSKANALYRCSWDLIDACDNGDVELKDVPTKDLPEIMQGQTMTERQAYLNETRAKRQRIKDRINELNAKRDTFIREEMARRAHDPSKAFDHALRTAIRNQARCKGFNFDG